MICRLCLCEYPLNQLKNIFAYQLKNSEESLTSILFWVFSVEVDVIDPYPKEVCDKCLVLIEHVLQIRNTFQTTQDVLHGKESEKYFVRPKQSLSEMKKPNLNKTIKDTEEDNKELESSTLPTVKVSLTNLDAICPVTLDLPKFENSPEFKAYKHLGFGRYKKRQKKRSTVECGLMSNISKILNKKLASNNSTRECIEVSTQTIFKDTGTETMAIGVNTDLIIPVGLTGPEKRNGVPVAHHIFNRINNGSRNDPSSLQVRSGHSTLDLLEIATHLSSMVTNSRSSSQDVGTNTEVPIKSSLTDKLVVDSSILSNFSLAVWVEPLEDILIRENYSEVRKDCFVKHRHEGDSDEEKVDEVQKEVEVFGAENEKDGIESKKRRLLNYYNNFRSFAVRELIEGKPIRESASNGSSDLLFKVSDVQSVHLCDLCSRTFKSKLALRFHVDKTHNAVKKRKLKVFRCKTCNDEFSSVIGRKHHKCQFHSSSDVSEDLPKSEAQSDHSKLALRVHIDEAHDVVDLIHQEEPKLFRCKTCHKEFSSAVGRSIHQRRFHSRSNVLLKLEAKKGDHSCDFCSKTFNSKLALKIHTSKSHYNLVKMENNIVYRCNACPRIFPNVRALNHHKVKLHDERTIRKGFPCPFCDQYFNGYGVLRHIAHRHPQHQSQAEKQNKCKICNRKFTSQMTLTCHMTLRHSSDGDEKNEDASGAGNRVEDSVTDVATVSAPTSPNKVTRGKTVATYNINDIINNYGYRWKVENDTKRGPINNTRSSMDDAELCPRVVAGRNENYIWDKKDLGDYSALSLYQANVNKVTRKRNGSEEVLDPKGDVGLDETIRKLAERLVDPSSALQTPSGGSSFEAL